MRIVTVTCSSWIHLQKFYIRNPETVAHFQFNQTLTQAQKLKLTINLCHTSIIAFQWDWNSLQQWQCKGSDLETNIYTNNAHCNKDFNKSVSHDIAIYICGRQFGLVYIYLLLSGCFGGENLRSYQLVIFMKQRPGIVCFNTVYWGL